MRIFDETERKTVMKAIKETNASSTVYCKGKNILKRSCNNFFRYTENGVKTSSLIKFFITEEMQVRKLITLLFVDQF